MKRNGVPSDHKLEEFQAVVWQYYAEYGREGLPWRLAEADGSFNPYKVVVSELMLQQTQVARVVPKYEQFLGLFPDVESLAAASLGDVLVAWQGLGYNRRAKFLWLAAQQVAGEYGGRFPREATELVKLPGIGPNTAGAIVAYTYNQPVAFIETNIRTVFIHHFFGDQTDVADKNVYTLVQAALPTDGNVREWYWALMDYGVHIKQTVGNTARASKSYVRQSPFEGSRRAVRGAVIRQLASQPMSYARLNEVIGDARLGSVLNDLVREDMVAAGKDDIYRLS